jgi:hypothetical protein
MHIGCWFQRERKHYTVVIEDEKVTLLFGIDRGTSTVSNNDVLYKIVKMNSIKLI